MSHPVAFSHRSSKILTTVIGKILEPQNSEMIGGSGSHRAIHLAAIDPGRSRLETRLEMLSGILSTSANTAV